MYLKLQKIQTNTVPTSPKFILLSCSNVSSDIGWHFSLTLTLREKQTKQEVKVKGIGKEKLEQ